MRLLAIIAPLAVLANVAQSQSPNRSYDADSVTAECNSEWGTDFQMVKYCIDQRAAGHVEYVEIVSRVSSSEELTKAMGNCENEWGHQWDMVAYCGNQQLQGYAQVSQLMNELPADLANTIVGGCLIDWGVDFSMVSYCAKNQYAAWQSLNN